MRRARSSLSLFKIIIFCLAKVFLVLARKIRRKAEGVHLEITELMIADGRIREQKMSHVINRKLLTPADSGEGATHHLIALVE